MLQLKPFSPPAKQKQYTLYTQKYTKTTITQIIHMIL